MDDWDDAGINGADSAADKAAANAYSSEKVNAALARTKQMLHAREEKLHAAADQTAAMANAAGDYASGARQLREHMQKKKGWFG
mmetsp:Transcript_48457/g.118604  ORF Transcript_48457/g.118604 Transcript_48457/m.118604 type:complete len:84 (+) Transcript_48457:1-252(+)